MLVLTKVMVMKCKNIRKYSCDSCRIAGLAHALIQLRITACFSVVLLLLFTVPVEAQPILRVNTAVGNTGANSLNSWSVIVPAPAASNTLVAVIALHASVATNGVTSISQSGANWVRAAIAPNSGGVDMEIWYAANLPPGADTNVTINTSSFWRSAAVIAEYSGLNPANLVDVTAVNSGTNNTSADTGTTATTTQTNELWFGGIGLATSASSLGAPNNSFTTVSNTAASSGTPSSNAGVYALEKIANAMGIANSGGTLNASANWNGVIVAFKGTTASTTNPPALTTNQIAAALAAFAGVHPRFLLNAVGVAALQAKTNSGNYATYWNTLYVYAKSLAASTPPAYTTNMDQRGSGDNLQTLAFSYLISKDTNLLAGAVKWAAAICNYPGWEGAAFQDGYGLTYGHHLMGLAMLYDYAYSDLDPVTKALIYNTMITHGGSQYNAFTNNLIGPNFLSNQNWIQSAAILAAGLATFDQTNSQALNWILLAENNYISAAQMLSSDGFHQEGAGYGEYGFTFLLQSFQLSRQLLSIDFISQTAQGWGANVGVFLTDFLVPRNSWAWYDGPACLAVVPFEDCHYYNTAPGYVLRGLAHLYQDTNAQWYADRLDAIPNINGNPVWQFLYWYDDSVPSGTPTNSATLHVFTNMCVVSSRSDWSGNEALLTFKCGGAVGSFVPAYFGNYFNNLNGDPGTGHSHPDAGSFCFFANGEWLMPEPSYVLRSTLFENTLIVDGAGQYGGPPAAYPTFSPLTTNIPALLYVNSTASLDTVVADATTAYPSSLGVQSFQRHVLFAKPDVLVVADSVQMNNTSHKLQLYFHLLNTNSVVKQPDGSLLVTSANTTSRMDVLTPSVSTMSNALQLITPRSAGEATNVETLVSFTSTGRTNWQNVMAFSWATNGATPAKATLLFSNGVNWVYQIGTHVVNLNWQTVPSNAPVALSSDEIRSYGTASTITATVSNSTGKVWFYLDGTNYGAPVILAGGNAVIPSTVMLGAGKHFVTALYSNDTSHVISAAANEAILNVTPIVAGVSGTRMYDATTNVSTGILSIVNNLDGPNLGLVGNGVVTNKNVGVQKFFAGQKYPARVNVATGYLKEGGAQPWPMTLPAPADGDTLVAVLSGHASSASPLATAITQTGANWTRAAYSKNPGGTATEIWYATNVVHAGTNVSIALNWRSAAVIAEYRGLVAVTPVDVTASNINISSTADTGTTPTTTQNNELWFGGIGLADSSDTLTAASNGFSIIGNSSSSGTTASSNAKVYAFEKVVSTTDMANTGGTITSPSAYAGGVVTDSIGWSGVMVAFKVAQVTTPLSLTGSATPNYALNGLTGFVTITNALLAVSGITATNKVYDGTALAKLNTNNVTWSGNLDGTNVLLNIAGASGNFLPDGSVGTNKTVQISGLTVSGSGTNNYLLIQPTTTANIAAFKVALNFSGNPATLTSIGNPGVSYVTQRSTNLVNWINISTNIAPSPSGVVTVSDSFVDLGGHQPPWAFYRMK